MADVLQENFKTGSSSGTGNVYGANYSAQTFNPASSHSVTKVFVWGYRVGSPGTVTISIRATTVGEPSGADLASGTMNGDTVTTSSAGEWIEVTLDSPLALSAGTTYAWVIKSDGINTSNRIRNLGNNAGYAGGRSYRSTDSGANWLTDFIPDDWWFQEYSAGINTYTLGIETDVSVKNIDITKTISTDVALSKTTTVTIASGVHTARLLTIASNVSIKQIDLTKTISTDVSTTILDRTVTISTEVHVTEEITGDTWPLARAAGYSADEFWDDETQSWYAVGTEIGSARAKQAGGRLKQNIVAMSNQGKIYYGDL